MFAPPLTLCGQALRFNEIARQNKVRAFGLEYAVVHLSDGGLLYTTRHGWPWLMNLLPEQWYDDHAYLTKGKRLTGGTGAVYQVPTVRPDGCPKDIVIKFSRYAQHVPLDVPQFFPDDVAIEEAGAAHFNGPFEEFGLLEELRRGYFGPQELNIPTKRPLAIYRPPNRVELWKSGRARGSFYYYKRRLKNDQDFNEDYDHIELDIEREYVAIFEFVKGEDAVDFSQQGLLSEDDLKDLTRRVVKDLNHKGFRVLDQKPKHFVLRKDRRHGGLLKRRGELVYALIDFELLMRTQEYQDFLDSHYTFHI